MRTSSPKGFTLIELLIVIGILAVLATVTVIALNPAQLFAQARDSQRMSDLSAVVGAINYYILNTSSPAFEAGPFSTNSTTCGFGASCTVRNTYGIGAAAGWVGVNISALTPPPVATWPRDPSNTATYQYSYKGDNSAKTFEVDARLESAQYRDKMVNDGGDKSTCSATYDDATCYFETGTALSL